MSAWGCPHDAGGVCQRVVGARCSPGMRGCVLEGRVRFAEASMNTPAKPLRAEEKKDVEEKSDAHRPRRRLPF